MKVAYVVADNPQEWNCAEWRCAVPCRALNAAGHKAVMVRIENFAGCDTSTELALIDADIIIVQRNLAGGKVLKAIDFWNRGAGKHARPVVVDFDDAYQLMPPTNVSYRYWGQNEVRRGDGLTEKVEPPAIEQFRMGVALCGYATMPSVLLAADYANYAKTYVVPNYGQLERYEKRKPFKHEGIIIGWGGSMSHVQSWQMSNITAALKRVVKARPNVTVEIHTADTRVFDLVDVPADKKTLVGWVSADDWPDQLNRFDIGAAPLHGGYDGRRSWIKVWELSVMRKPWVASDGPAYRDLVKYGKLVRNTPKDWEVALLNTIDRLGTPEMAAFLEGSYQWAAAQAISRNVENIVATYQAIIDDFKVTHGSN